MLEKYFTHALVLFDDANSSAAVRVPWRVTVLVHGGAQAVACVVGWQVSKRLAMPDEIARR
ncbi:hypothetical protein BA896_010835 [Janthinobacterium lividum]|uniref:Uncharacterized protein n=1 Tax=Janthinobacterium lividum TaxID=29581 RepID=A0A1E8PSK7_9BURK|nr:hypothetical protein BA896_010835 [Janthinobacterium lividum]